MSLAGRLALSLFAVLFALYAGWAGLDRQGVSTRTGPDYLRSESLRVGAARLLEAGDTRLAEIHAQRAVAADPFDQRGVALLATTQLANGKREEAGRAFTAAEALGGRSLLVHAYFFDIAIASRNAARAAERLDAILRVEPDLPAQERYFESLETLDDGRAMLAKRLLEEPDWAQSYLTGYRAGDKALARRAGYLASGRGAPALGCKRIARMLEELEKRDLRAEAMSLASRQCPRLAMKQTVRDGSFEHLGDEGRLGWRRHSSGDISITSVGTANKAVELQNRSAATKLVLSQTVLLRPGDYRVFASVSGPRPENLVATLDCGEPKRPPRRSGALVRGQLVTAPACDGLVLGLWLRPASSPLRLDDLRLAPVGALGPQPSRTE